jgi:hypothetical protein
MERDDIYLAMTEVIAWGRAHQYDAVHQEAAKKLQELRDAWWREATDDVETGVGR